uniref:Uncharacterized protein n=1 Tax=Knipowitschia caucasica TaxID=637954 RepID=A0AAV2KV45_KNICA
MIRNSGRKRIPRRHRATFFWGAEWGVTPVASVRQPHSHMKSPNPKRTDTLNCKESHDLHDVGLRGVGIKCAAWRHCEGLQGGLSRGLEVLLCGLSHEVQTCVPCQCRRAEFQPGALPTLRSDLQGPLPHTDHPDRPCPLDRSGPWTVRVSEWASSHLGFSSLVTLLFKWEPMSGLMSSCSGQLSH